MESKAQKSREKVLAKMLSLIKKSPGIRPFELNRHLNRKHSANLRNILLRRKLVRKETIGVAVHYYPARTGGVGKK